MGYKDLVESGASTPEMQAYLTDSELVTVTLRLPRTMRDSAKEYATLNGMNFTTLVKQCLIEKLTKQG
jgi:predicted DNA binding CopG/RHH family protein